MKNITVIGSGTMGNGIAHVFAQTGFSVSLVDISEAALAKAIQTIAKNLGRMVKKEKITEADKTATLANIKVHTNLADSNISEADLVVEAATEKEGLKLKIFQDIDRLAPAKAILASNTSSISITKIASATTRPAQVIGMHFFNPVPIMKLVEVIKGYKTSDATTKTIVELSKQLGKTPVEANDYPGFVANRILMPMINEAVCALHEGVAGVAEIDTVMKLGMGHPMGPLQLADFIGLDVCLSILEVLYNGFKQPKYAASPLLVKMVNAGQLGRKSGQGFYDYAQGGKTLIVAPAFN